MKKQWLILAAVLAVVAGGLWAWRNYHRPPVPAETQAIQEISEGLEAVGKADMAIKKGRAIIRALPGEATEIEKTAVDAASSADLATLADRANARIREWSRQHPSGGPDGGSAAGAGAVLPGGGGSGE